MTKKPWVIGFLQAVGLTVYITLFATFVQNVAATMETKNETVGMISALLAFVASALISGSIILLRPIILFFDGKKKEALHIIFWSAVWLIAFFAIFILVNVL